MSADPTRLNADDLLAHAEFVRRLARRLASDDDAAEDVAQDAWLAALESPPRRTGALRAWLGRVTHSLALKRKRDEWRRSRRERASARPERLPSAADLVVRESVLRALVDAVLSMDEPYRSTILMHFYEDLSSAEIARLSGVPAGTVRSRLHRALEQVKERLDREHSGDREAWCIGLAALVGLSTESLAASAPATKGMVLMGLKLKSVLAVTLAVLALLSLWTLLGERFREAAPLVSQAPGPTRERVPAFASAGAAPVAETSGANEIELPLGTATRGEEEEPQGSLLVRVTWAEDGLPAEAVRACIYSWEDNSPHALRVDAVTGPDGTFLVEGITAGRVVVTLDRGGGASTEVRANELTALNASVPPGFMIEGVVVDGKGEPVADADIWLSQYGNSGEGRVIAQAGPEGAFRLRSLSTGHYLGARKSGYAPSRLLRVQGSPGDTLSYRLVLSGPGGVIRGRVLDAGGLPVACAAVEIGPWQGQDTRLETGERASPAPPLRLRTDPDGRFAVDGVPLGASPIAVRARLFAPWKGKTRVEAGRPAEVEARLCGGASVVGAVRDGKGEPVAGAFVGVGGYGDFLSSMTETDGNGSFRLRGLAPGEISIRASAERKGRVEAKLVARSGEVVRWEARLDRGRVIEGRVVDGDGRPLEAMMVDAKDRNQQWWGQSTTDSDGRFAILNCPDRPCRLTVTDLKQRIGYPLATVEDVVADSGETVIRIQEAERPSAIITGALTDPDGAPAGSVQVIVMNVRDAEGGPSLLTDRETGVFQTGPLSPGRYGVHVMEPRRGSIYLGEHELAVGQTLDLGVTRFEAPGTLTVLLRRENERVRSAPKISLSRDTPPWQGLDGREFDGELPPSLSLPPGDWVLIVEGPDIAGARHSFQIRPGEATYLDVELQEVILYFRFTETPERTEPASVHLVIQDDETGTVVVEADAVRTAAGRLECELRIPAGTYRAVATRDTGAVGALEFTHRGFTSRDRLIEIPLGSPARK